MDFPWFSEVFNGGKLTSNSKFRIWKCKMDFVLFQAGVLYVLHDPKPADPTPASTPQQIDAHRKWVDDNLRCRSMILLAMEDALFLSFDRYKIAKEMMDALTKFFISNTVAHQMLLFNDYTHFKMSEDASVMDHILEMGSMAVDLEEAGMPVPEPMQMVVLMNSLPHSWNSVLRIVVLKYPKEGELTLEKLTSHLSLENKYRKLEAEKEMRGPLKKKQKMGNKGVKGNCYCCGKPGHFQVDCPDQE